MQMAGRVWVSMLVVLAWLRAAPAYAETRGLVLIGGTAAERYGGTVGTAVEAAVRDLGWVLPAEPLTKSQAEVVRGCLDAKRHASCLPAALRIARVIVVRIEREVQNGTAVVVLTGKGIGFAPASAAIRQQHCEHCDPDRLGDASVTLAKLVLEELSLRARDTVVALRSTPEGAQVVLDGNRVGVTNATFHTYPGKHMVRFEKPGFLDEVREFTAHEGRSAEVRVRLRAATAGAGADEDAGGSAGGAGADAADATMGTGMGAGMAAASGAVPAQEAPLSRAARTQWIAGGLLSTGAVLIATGAVWLYYGAKDGPDEKYIYTRATGLGVAASLIGLGMAATGGYMWWRSMREATAPVVAPVPGGGAVLGWAGRF